MIRVVIVDDERPPRERIRALLAAHPSGVFEVVGEAGDGSTAVERITRLRPDLLFLDIQLPGLDGFEILDLLGEDTPPAVVFVTAYDEHALRAFDRHAVDYVQKPIVPARFHRAADRAVARLAGHLAPGGEIVRMMEEWIRDRALPRRFASRIGTTVRLVSDHEIDWLESAGNYVRLHVGPERLPVRAAMKDLAARLDPTRFLRIHRSTIVRLEAIARLRAEGDGEYTVTLRDGTELRSSRRYGTALRSLLR